jgi:hypothetical protein
MTAGGTLLALWEQAHRAGDWWALGAAGHDYPSTFKELIPMPHSSPTISSSQEFATVGYTTLANLS